MDGKINIKYVNRGRIESRPFLCISMYLSMLESTLMKKEGDKS